MNIDYKEPSVRLLLYHLYVAMDIYRYMTSSEKNKAGFWYRTFRNSYRLTGFLKERKRKRDKEKSPLHPSYKERETEVKEKEEKQTEQNTATGDAVLEGFRKECLRHVGQYGQELVEDFYYHWKQVDKKTGKRLFEGKRCFDIDSHYPRRPPPFVWQRPKASSRRSRSRPLNVRTTTHGWSRRLRSGKPVLCPTKNG